MKRRKGKKSHNTEWIKDIVAVILFLLMFPYFAMSFLEQKNEWDMNKKKKAESGIVTDYELKAETMANSLGDTELDKAYQSLIEISKGHDYTVRWRVDNVKVDGILPEEKEIPVEAFMLGALAGSIEGDYELESIKAQAVVLRSTLYQNYQKEGKKTCSLNADVSSYLTDKQMQLKWGKDYDTYCQKFIQAVSETQGVVMCCDGKPVTGCYHGMSAGETRDGSELSKEGEYKYLMTADCSENLGAENYVQKKKIKKQKTGEIKINETDENGYVISLYRDNNLISGEAFREEFELASSNFSFKDLGNYYEFSTKGIGHGFGYDQYYGNYLAGTQKDYQEILKYFFTDITFERME